MPFRSATAFSWTRQATRWASILSLSVSAYGTAQDVIFELPRLALGLQPHFTSFGQVELRIGQSHWLTSDI